MSDESQKANTLTVEEEALEIAVKAGIIPPQIPWAQAKAGVIEYFVELGKRLQKNDKE